MSQHQSMEQYPEPQQERLYNTDPREQSYYRESSLDTANYEEGYQGYRPSYLQGEKLHPRPPKQQTNQAFWFIVIVLIIFASSGGWIGSLFGTIMGFLWGSLGLIIAGFVVLVLISIRPVRLPRRTFAIAEHAQLTIRTEAGNVRIVRGQSDQVEVGGTYYVSKLFGDQHRQPLRYQQNGDHLSITTERWGLFRMGYVTMEIVVPAHSDIQTQSNAGTITINGVNGRINAQTNAGTITIGEVNGYVNVQTNAGTIDVTSSELATSSSLRTNAGTITINRTAMHAGTRGHTNAGTITINDGSFDGGASFTTNAGTINVTSSFAPNGEYRFETHAGTIDVNLPAYTDFALNAHTHAGTVNNEFRNNIVGDGPYARLNLNSHAGNITIRRV